MVARTFVYGPLGKKVPKTRGGGHVEHHAETLDDMTLKTDAKWRSTKVGRASTMICTEARPSRGR